MSQLTPEDQAKQIRYRDARFTKQYDGIWQSVGKCVFCDLNNKYVIFEENGIALTVQLYAYIDGHLMIVPKRHVTSAKELTPLEWQTIRKCLYVAKKLFKQVHNIGGMQLVQKDGAAAQSTVEHIHFHAIPFDAPDLCVWNYRQLKYTPMESANLYRAQDKKIAKLAAKFDEKYHDGAEANEPNADPFALKWSNMAFGSKKAINTLDATFIAASRELSTKRFTQLVKEYLPTGNIVLGLSEEPYVLGFESQPQFRTATRQTFATLIDKVNNSNTPHKIYTLAYSQRDTNYLLQKLKFKQALFVNGSWQHTFHTQSLYYTLMDRGVPYKLISPFADEQEARTFEAKADLEITAQQATHPLRKKSALTDVEMLELASVTAQQSYDYSFQTGVALGKKSGKNYKPLLTTFNKVVPYQTFAMLHGASRETHFSPPHDLNHYDAVHAEVEAIVQAGKQGIDLAGTTLFINLLPCPSCARMFAQTEIKEFVYRLDHSDGYAVAMLEAAGKTVRRITTTQQKD